MGFLFLLLDKVQNGGDLFAAVEKCVRVIQYVSGAEMQPLGGNNTITRSLHHYVSARIGQMVEGWRDGRVDV